MAQAAIFDDGNDRKILFDLRLKPESRLTAEERMILRAADRYGNVGFCSKSGGNATLIDYFGRPAIITSAHLFFDSETGGRQKCTDAELRSATYMPNVSYIDARSRHPRSFTHRKVGLVMPAVNIDMEVRKRDDGTPNTQDDFIIFYVAEDVSGDIMPESANGLGGHKRGAMPVPSKSSRQGALHMIGVAPDIEKSLAVLYQTCRFRNLNLSGLAHDCDTVSGSSGSALAVEQDVELYLLGIHKGDLFSGKTVPPTNDYYDWNIGTGLMNNPKFQAPEGGPIRNPALIPYQLQFLLHRAGDYTGKLDNKWGPGSRKALDAFVARTGACLPGRDPSMELWDALEAAVKEPKAGCAPSPQVAAAGEAVPQAAAAVDSGVEALGAMLDAVCVAGRLEPRAVGPLLESWTRDNGFEIAEHQPAKDTSREESWQMRKDGRIFAASFLHAGADDAKKACRVLGFDVDPDGMRDHIAARYGWQQAEGSGDAALLAAWTGRPEGYAGAMTIEIRKIEQVVDVWFRE